MSARWSGNPKDLDRTDVEKSAERPSEKDSSFSRSLNNLNLRVNENRDSTKERRVTKAHPSLEIRRPNFRAGPDDRRGQCL